MADGSKTAVPSGEVVHQDLPPLKGLPDNLTYNDLIARNKRNSSFLVVLMVVILSLIHISEPTRPY